MFYLRNNCYTEFVRFPLIFARLGLIYSVFLKQMDKKDFFFSFSHMYTCTLLKQGSTWADIRWIVLEPIEKLKQ